MAELKNVVIVGLGPGGSHTIENLEPKLPPSHRVVGINREEYVFNTISSLRGAVVPSWEEISTIKLDDLFTQKRNVVLAGTTVVDVTPTHVRVDKQHKDKGFSFDIPYDVLVLSTGSRYPFPARPPVGKISKADAHAAFVELQDQVKQSHSVLVVGGGAVGVEFAGEVAAAYPDKTVTLVHAHDRLHGALFKQSFHDGLASQLSSLGVKIHLNSRVDYKGNRSGKIDRQVFTLSDGTEIEADFILLAQGNAPNGQIAGKLSPDLVTPEGFVKVRQTLQVASSDPALARVFALGDASQVEGVDLLKTSVSAMFQSGVVAKNILALIAGKGLSKFSAPPILGVVTAGPEMGMFQLPYGFVFGSWAAKRFKSRKLMTPMIYGRYHAKAPDTYTNAIPA